MTGIAKAWVFFNGAATPVINGSFNVSSVTYNSTGNYTINYTTAMPNSNYSVLGMSQTKQSVNGCYMSIFSNSGGTVTQYNTTGVCVATAESTTGASINMAYNSVAVFSS
jgi:hypothetical protein